ncbi:MAG TPA: SRPBCC family protein [Candidatus Saccharimonadales bacterium]|nr:SRPBCC family protein [Candidatus Saccharimonadales bacterium]
MWSKTYSITTKKVTGEQIWKLFADVNNWHTWDKGTEYAKLDGKFEAGNYFILKPKGGPKVKVKLIEVVKNKKFVDVTHFPLAQMYDEHLFDATPEGLKITYTISVKGLLAFLWVKIVAQNIVNNLRLDAKNQIEAASKL